MTIGIVGGGQLGALMASEAARLGIHVTLLCAHADDPGARVARDVQVGALDDPGHLQHLADRCDVVTLENENVPATSLPTHPRLHPTGAALGIVQDRLAQRRFLADLGIAQTQFSEVTDGASLLAAGERLALPGILKTSRGGYDGHGQRPVRTVGDLWSAWQGLGQVPCVLESFVSFRKEISVVLARDRTGQIAHFPVAENVHIGGVLHTTFAPADISEPMAIKARSIGGQVAAALGHIGVLTVEMFVLADGQLLVNEVALRVHNSGHFTLGGCVVSQFEQHVRAICGLPLGDPSLLRPTAMVNLLGDLWQAGPPRFAEILATPGVRLNLYAKAARPGRKMGHVLAMDESAANALAKCEALFARLSPDKHRSRYTQ